MVTSDTKEGRGGNHISLSREIFRDFSNRAKTNIGFTMSLTSPIVKIQLVNTACISQHDLVWFPVSDDEEKKDELYKNMN